MRVRGEGEGGVRVATCAQWRSDSVALGLGVAPPSLSGGVDKCAGYRTARVSRQLAYQAGAGIRAETRRPPFGQPSME